MTHRDGGPGREAALAAPLDGLHVEVVGRGSAVGALFVPSALGAGCEWRTVASLVADRAETACVLFDLRGFGRSATPVAGPTHAADLAGLVEQHRPQLVVGSSFGCALALELARSRPDLVGWLLLTSPRHPSTRSAAARDHDLRVRLARARGDLAGALDREVGRWFGPTERGPAATLVGEMFTDSLARDPDLEGLAASAVATERLGEVTCPVTILVGEGDGEETAATVALIDAATGGPTEVLVRPGGHFPHLHDPDAVAGLIVDRLSPL